MSAAGSRSGSTSAAAHRSKGRVSCSAAVRPSSGPEPSTRAFIDATADPHRASISAGGAVSIRRSSHTCWISLGNTGGDGHDRQGGGGGRSFRPAGGRARRRGVDRLPSRPRHGRAEPRALSSDRRDQATPWGHRTCTTWLMHYTNHVVHDGCTPSSTVCAERSIRRTGGRAQDVARACSIASTMRAGVRGRRVRATPSGASASLTALTTAGGAPMAPPSPTPL